MNLIFYKYHGTGNDFILIDAREMDLDMPPEQVRLLCDRHYGIGADGFIALVNSDHADFKMIYYNSDGNLSTMCGNGGRCISNFAYKLGICRNRLSFEAVDGIHDAIVGEDDYVELKMQGVSDMLQNDNVFILNTGSPHYVRFVKDIKDQNIVEVGRLVRYSPKFKKNGINVNLAMPYREGVRLLTYERGVEDETLSCGTGVTAVALAASVYYPELHNHKSIDVYAKGGKLSVKFVKTHENSFQGIWLCGNAIEVFSGNIRL